MTCEQGSIFPRSFTHGGNKCKGTKHQMGGTHEGGHSLMGGPNFDRLYHKLKVPLLLSCNYTMQFIGYDSILKKLVDLYLIAFKSTQ